MSKRIVLKPALCPPKKRIEGVTRQEWIKTIQLLEQKAQDEMNSLCCGSENWEYKIVGEIADMYWRAAALIRLHLANIKVVGVDGC